MRAARLFRAVVVAGAALGGACRTPPAEVLDDGAVAFDAALPQDSAEPRDLLPDACDCSIPGNQGYWCLCMVCGFGCIL